VVIAGVLKKQLEAAKNLSADRVLAKVKPGGTFASVTGAPANAAKYPQVRTAAFEPNQDTKNPADMVEAVRAAKRTIPIGSRLPLRNAAEAHAAFAKGSAGKMLLLP
jgi:hypothetical protein